MKLPTIQELVALTDLHELVARYATPTKRNAHSSCFHCPNPLHEDKHPSFTVSLSRSGKQVARCHSQCAWRGDALDFLKWIENVNTSEALTLLRDFLGVRKISEGARNVNTSRPLQNKCTPIAGEKARKFLEKYCLSRSWPLEVIESYGLHVVLDSKNEPRVRHNYYVKNFESGELVPGYWQDRGGKNSQPKWLSPRGSTPILFNLPSLEIANLEAVVICEGAPDTITASLALEGCSYVAVVGVPGVNAWQPKWAELFTGRRVVVAADRDAAGEALEQAIRSSLETPPAYFRPSRNDLTETAKEIGLPKLRELLLEALGTQPEASERTLQDTVSLLLEHFPSGSLVEGESL